MTTRKQYTVHIASAAGSRFSTHDSEEEMRTSLIEYWNEVLSDDESEELNEDASLEEAIEKIEEMESVSWECIWLPHDNKYEISPEERDTILAALRLWQDFREGHPADEPKLRDIATNDGAHEMLSFAAIDALCERLNV